MQAQDRPQPQPGKSPEVNINKPQIFILANGLKVMVVEDHKLPRVSYTLTLDNAPFVEGSKKGVDNLTSAMLGSGSKKIAKDDFNEEIDFYGASINFSSKGASASCLTRYAFRVLELLADGALHPNFTEIEFEKEKTKMLEGLKTQEKSVSAISSRISNVLAFGKKHPSGEYSTTETVNSVTLADIQENYQNNFVPENAYLVVLGDIKLETIKQMIEELFGSWEKKSPLKTTYPEPQNAEFTQINFVDMPNAVQSEISVLNILKLKMSDPDFFPASIAAYILGGNPDSYLMANIREKKGYTYSINTYLQAGKYDSKVVSSTAVRNAVTADAVVEIIKEIKRIRIEKVSNEDLANAKALYCGNFVMQVEKPQAIARFALNVETQNLPKDFYENFIQNLNAVTADQVQQAAAKYFLVDNLRIVIVGKALDVLPDLEKLAIPLCYFDKNGSAIQK